MLVETLDELPGDEAPTCWWIVAAGSDEARATADVLRVQLGVPALAEIARLAPRAWSPFGGSDSEETLDDLTKALNASSGASSPVGLVLVLHEPQAAWLIRALSGRDVSLERAGIAWLVSDGVRRLRRGRRRCWTVWSTIEPGEGSLEAVVKKVEVKYRTAGALGAFLTALVTFLAARFSDRVGTAEDLEIGLWAGALACIGLGAVLNFVALFEYDRLQMPTRYWGAGAPREDPVFDPRRSGLRAFRRAGVVARPPANAERVVVESSQRIWALLVVPPLLLLGLGLVLLAGAVAHPKGVSDLAGIPIAVSVLAVGLAAWWLARAPLGTSD